MKIFDVKHITSQPAVCQYETLSQERDRTRNNERKGKVRRTPHNQNKS